MKRRPRILVYFAGGFEHAGGIGRVLGNLLHASQAAGRPYDMTVIDTRGPFSILVSPIFFAWALVRTVFATLTGERIVGHVNVAHGGSTVRKVIVCHLLAMMRVPYLLHLHDNHYDVYFRAQPAWGRTLIRRAFLAADKVVVLGTLWRNLVVDEIGADPAKVVIVRNGVPDPGEPIPGRQSACPEILFLGALEVWKGLGELIDALASETLRNLPWKLICAGRGMQAKYQAAAKQAGIGERVVFTGWMSRDDVQSLLRDASIVALPSHMEGLSVTLIEALAQGVPVVATLVGAHADILRDHENAIVVTPKDPVSLAQGLRCLLLDGDLAGRIGRTGRILFEQCLEIGRVESHVHDIYDELLQGKPKSPIVPKTVQRGLLAKQR
jgi:glycosyltransferase involved in cell wall biosynthesis